jgi:hypothetical protein
MLFTLVVPTVVFGIYPAPILDCLNYAVSGLIYSSNSSLILCEAAEALQPVNKEYAFELHNICSYILNYPLFYIVISVLLTISILLGIVYLASTQNSNHNHGNGHNHNHKHNPNGKDSCKCTHPVWRRFQMPTFFNRNLDDHRIANIAKCPAGKFIYPSNMPNG